MSYGRESRGSRDGTRILSAGSAISQGESSPEEALIPHHPGHYPESLPPIEQQTLESLLIAEPQNPSQSSGSPPPSYVSRPTDSSHQQPTLPQVQRHQKMDHYWAERLLPWPNRYNGIALLTLIFLLIFALSFTAGWWSCKHAKCG